MPRNEINRCGPQPGRAGPRRSWNVLFLSGVAALAVLAAASAASSAAPRPEPKRVLLLDSFNRDLSPNSAVSAIVRTELVRSYGAPINFLQATLEAQGLEPANEDAVIAYVRVLCGRRAPDLVITNAAPAFLFFQRNRQRLAPGVPVVHGSPDERFLRDVVLSPEETAVAGRLDLPTLVGSILEVLPRTREVFFIYGEAPLERFWSEQFRRECEPLRSRVRLTSLEGLSLDALLRRSAALPPDSAIFLGMMLRDAEGVPLDHHGVLELLHTSANAPIFSWSTASIGRGAVGGRLVPVEAFGREIAAVASRILKGESPASIPVKTIGLGSPVYDARELERWGIDEKSLPPGSEVRFRPPSFMQLYRGRILAGAAVILFQAFVIGALLGGRRRRRRAEQEAAKLRRELAHVGRVSVLGQLSSSLAHELSQPLGAILRNAEAAELFLATETPDLGEIRSIVADIKADEHRAGNVIERMRGFLRHQEPKRATLDPAALVEGVVTLIGPELRSRGIRLETTVARQIPTVTGDPVHFQQILLNLLVNAMEAMETTPRDVRVLSVEVTAAEGGALEIAVRDSGPGIPPGEAPRIFEPFHTTKPAGLGMGLAISRALVEAHGGHLRLEANERGGATFVVSLPAGGASA